MNKKIILEIGIPMMITNRNGRIATIRLNEDEFVVCDFGPNESFHLSDVMLKGWYPKNLLKRFSYSMKLRHSKKLTA
jgi:hypothetical protein